jgi:toxin ParE1/3/4
VRLRWSRLARRDLADIKRFIEDDNPQAASAQVARIRRSAARIEEFPESGPLITTSGLRATGVPGTAYRIVYRIEADLILIVAVWHGARAWPFDPR